MLWRKLLSGASRLLLTWLCAGLFGAALVRLAPGFGVDELELDARLSRESIQAIREARGAEGGIAASYWRYLRNAASGDLGMSSSMGRPIAELLGDRLPLTLRSVAFGLTL
ncbi:MAG: hypothetical protein HYR60_13550, partial [Acidobacteria bacterium]|nr:hypothetical protein [Acidobacteriota bacterium]